MKTFLVLNPYHAFAPFCVLQYFHFLFSHGAGGFHTIINLNCNDKEGVATWKLIRYTAKVLKTCQM